MATTGKKSTASGKKSAPAAHAAQRPIRREVWAVVCFFVGLFSFIGYFNVEALFITYFCTFIKGLIGYGYYFFPVALLVCGGILLLHHGRPVRARAVCMIVLPLALGALTHLIFCKIEFGAPKITELLPVLYDNGKRMLSGGLVCGFLAIGFEKLFSIYGAIPVFFFASLVLAMVSFRITPAKIAEKIKSRERREYIPEPEVERPVRAHAAPAVQEAANSRRRRRAIDIPMDDETQEEYRE